MMKLKEHGYEPNAGSVARPRQDDESVEAALCGYSEKLAIAYNLIEVTQPSVIELTNNLRIGADCGLHR